MENKVEGKNRIMNSALHRAHGKAFAVILAALIMGAVCFAFNFGKIMAFVGPSQSPPNGYGVISTNDVGNIAVGTSTARSETKVFIAASSTDTSSYALKIVQPSGAPILYVRNDGKVSIATSSFSGGGLTVEGNVYSTDGFSGSIAASNVTAGVFGTGNFAFPSSLGIATTTQVGLPQSLSVYGGGYFSGSVGIGVVSPAVALQVNGRIYALGSRFGNVSIGGYGAWSYTSDKDISAGPSGADLSLQVDSGGSVGIGTSAPAYKLDVQGGQINASGGLCIAGDCKTAWSQVGGGGGGVATTTPFSAGYIPYTTSSLALTNSVIYQSGGYIGIGTTSPATKLTIAGTGTSNGITIGDANLWDEGTWFHIQHNAVNSWWGGGNIYFNLGDAAGSNKFYIRDSASSIVSWINSDGAAYFAGSVGIGTASPAYKLDVRGDIITGVDGSGGALILSAQDGTNEGGQMYWHGAGTNPSWYQDIYADTMRFWSSQLGGGNYLVLHANGNVTMSVGSFGIGTTSPGYKLDVASGGSTTARLGTASGDTVVIGGGSGKLTVGTIDPVYNISGEKYATYIPGMTGQKEETTGIIKIQSSDCKHKNGELNSKICEYNIDFNKLDKGSDLWLFYQATDFGKNFDKLTILLTPNFNGNVWYKKIPEMGIVKIYSESDGEISYRLTAPRFDWRKWGNVSSDKGASGLKIPEK